MLIVHALLQELDQEATTTRRVLERVPGDRLAWKPHDRSMSLGQLALHVATVPGAIAEMSRKSPFQVGQFVQPSPANVSELIPALDRSVARAREILSPMNDAELDEIWRATDGTSELMALPVGALFRTIMLNHWYHHRGQLSVYLRQVGALVPSIYGPSADENPFARTRPATVSV
jgi:uncharacterized damage-inducible protein DinB